MNIDCAYAIGTEHQVCQDYVRKSDHAVVLSDGCSGSVDTDFGARILCASAIAMLDDYPEQEGIFHHSVLAHAISTVKNMG